MYFLNKVCQEHACPLRLLVESWRTGRVLTIFYNFQTMFLTIFQVIWHHLQDTCPPRLRMESWRTVRVLTNCYMDNHLERESSHSSFCVSLQESVFNFNQWCIFSTKCVNFQKIVIIVRESSHSSCYCYFLCF